MTKFSARAENSTRLEQAGLKFQPGLKLSVVVM